MATTNALATNNYGPAKFIVALSGNGTDTTLAAAMAKASAGDTIFLRDSVTENVTITPGVNITAWQGESLNTPTITGTLTMTGAGTSTISGINLTTNSAAIIAVTGSSASILNIDGCYLNCTNATGITFSSSSGSSVINIKNCQGNLGTTGIGLFAASGSGAMIFSNNMFSNTGLSTTASTCSSGSLDFIRSRFAFPITMTSTSTGSWDYSTFSTVAQNVTSANLNGGAVNVRFCRFESGTASAVSIASATVFMEFCTISSTNTNAITGAGTINYSQLSFDNTSNTINVTTQTPVVTKYGVNLSTIEPAFSAYLASNATDKTGNGAVYQLGTDALTEIYDQASNFNTNGTFTAPYTGKYELNAGVIVFGCTIAVNNNFSLVTSNRTYTTQNARAAGNSNIPAYISVLADMDAADTAVVTTSVTGEAGNTDDILGGATVTTYFNGRLAN